MKRRTIGMAALAAVGIVSWTQRAHGQTEVSWASPASGDWSNPLNWSPNEVPNNAGPNTYNATIGVAGVYTVNLDLDVTIEKLTFNATGSVLQLADNADLTLNTDWLMGGTEFNGRRDLGGLGTLTVLGDITFSDARLRHTTQVVSSGTWTFNSAIGDEICDTGVDHGGNAAWQGSGDILLGRGATFRTGISSVFSVQSAATFGFNGMGAEGAFINRGTFRKESAGLTRFDRCALDNQSTGVVEVTTGQLRANRVNNLAGGTLTGGFWKVSAGAALSFVDLADVVENVATNAADVTLDGAGALFDSLDALGVNDTAGVLTIKNGRNFTTLDDFTNNGRLSIGPATEFKVATGKNLTNLSGGVLSAGVYEIGGTLRVDNAAVSTLNASLTLDGAASALLDQSGGDALTTLATIDNAGSMTIRNSRNFTTGGDFTVNPSGVLNVDAGTLFRVKPGSSLTNFSGGSLTSGVFNVRGTLQADNAQVQIIDNNLTIDGSGSSIIDADGNDAFSVLRTVQTNGNFTVTGGRNLTVANPDGKLNTVTGSTMKIGATSFRTPSVVTVLGDFEQEPGSELTLAGGRLDTTGLITLSGLLSGNGTINGRTVVDGEISPGNSPGSLSFLKVLRLEDSALFTMQIEGPSGGSAFDTIRLSESLQFTDQKAGLLRVVLDAAYRPGVGEAYELITFAGGRSGVFSSFEVLGLPPDMTASLVYSSTSIGVRFGIVPAPGAALGLLVGMLSCVRSCRRRPGRG
ncbi:MAG: hypothetical protein JNL50_09245 [Phycisphaerae bacterium]|nr:hypothetical protein [Phycisphaerae bacterium]